jgi:glycosyltransferase involved in cell wall biosynthesis
VKVFLYSPVHFEQWDWRNSVEKGIGGSETSHVEMAWRLARRGHEVISYGPVPKDVPTPWRGVEWRPLRAARFSEPGLWVLYRCPAILDKFGPKRADQPRWLMCQDEDYRDQWTPGRAMKLDRVLALCETHAQTMVARHPELDGLTVVTGNGLKMELVREVEAEGLPTRNPNRLMWAPSPDRGLVYLLRTFRRAREFNPDLELHGFYGLDNIEKLIKYRPEFSHYRTFREDLIRELDQPGVTWHGRVDQPTLYREWLKTALWPYQTNFTETSCITSMEAQALGAVPIYNPIWALKHNVVAGLMIRGDAYGDALVRARYAAAIAKLSRDPALQDAIRAPMMLEARQRFNWERVVDQWEAWLHGYDEHNAVAQFAFQIKHARGCVLNVGSDNDWASIRARFGAVNLDVRTENPVTGAPTQPDIVADFRTYRPRPEFDTVILGDILEHMSQADGVRMLKNAVRALRPGGRVIVTAPEADERPATAQHAGSVGDELYAPGVSAFHSRRLALEDLDRMFNRAGLQLVVGQVIDYTTFVGHGVVGIPKEPATL